MAGKAKHITFNVELLKEFESMLHPEESFAGALQLAMRSEIYRRKRLIEKFEEEQQDKE